jgi:hypothetical protein
MLHVMVGVREVLVAAARDMAVPQLHGQRESALPARQGRQGYALAVRPVQRFDSIQPFRSVGFDFLRVLLS